MATAFRCPSCLFITKAAPYFAPNGAWRNPRQRCRGPRPVPVSSGGPRPSSSAPLLTSRPRQSRRGQGRAVSRPSGRGFFIGYAARNNSGVGGWSRLRSALAALRSARVPPCRVRVRRNLVVPPRVRRTLPLSGDTLALRARRSRPAASSLRSSAAAVFTGRYRNHLRVFKIDIHFLSRFPLSRDIRKRLRFQKHECG